MGFAQVVSVFSSSPRGLVAAWVGVHRTEITVFFSCAKTTEWMGGLRCVAILSCWVCLLQLRCKQWIALTWHKTRTALHPPFGILIRSSFCLNTYTFVFVVWKFFCQHRGLFQHETKSEEFVLRPRSNAFEAQGIWGSTRPFGVSNLRCQPLPVIKRMIGLCGQLFFCFLVEDLVFMYSLGRM